MYKIIIGVSAFCQLPYHARSCNGNLLNKGRAQTQPTLSCLREKIIISSSHGSKTHPHHPEVNGSFALSRESD